MTFGSGNDVHFFSDFRTSAQDHFLIVLQGRALVFVFTTLAVAEFLPKAAESQVQVISEIKDIFGFLKDRAVEQGELLEKKNGRNIGQGDPA